MSQGRWKSVLVGSAMALGSQAGIANKPLPCPVTTPLLDLAGVVQEGTRDRIYSRLMQLDTQKHHQVVVVTVENISDYGYDSIEQMANALGTECKIGYRGENTGVVVLYTMVPSLFRIETADTERYLTDAVTKRIIGHSKSPEICKKEDVSCRLDDITEQIGKVIQTTFPDAQSVQTIVDETQKFDEKESQQIITGILNSLGIGAVVIAVIGGAGYAGNRMIKSRRRTQLKKRMFESQVGFKKVVSKYPSWFRSSSIQRADGILSKLLCLSDDELDDIIGNQRQMLGLDREFKLIEESLVTAEQEYVAIISSVESKKQEASEIVQRALQFDASLRSQGFVYSKTSVPAVFEGDNPTETLSILGGCIRKASEVLSGLERIPLTYKSFDGFVDRLRKSYSEKLEAYNKTSIEYASVFGKNTTDLDVGMISRRVDVISQKFQDSYVAKNMQQLNDISTQAETLFTPLDSSTKSMRLQLEWFRNLHAKIQDRKVVLNSIRFSPEYVVNAKKYAQKTGRTSFQNYNMIESLERLIGEIGAILDNYANKTHLEEIDGKIKEFDKSFAILKEYIGLGPALTAIIAEEVAEIERAARAKKRREEEEAQRKVDELKRKEDTERRRKQQERDDEERRRRDTESDYSGYGGYSRSDTGSSWSSGGGGGFSGGGSTDD